MVTKMVDAAITGGLLIVTAAAWLQGIVFAAFLIGVVLVLIS